MLDYSTPSESTGFTVGRHDTLVVFQLKRSFRCPRLVAIPPVPKAMSGKLLPLPVTLAKLPTGDYASKIAGKMTDQIQLETMRSNKLSVDKTTSSESKQLDSHQEGKDDTTVQPRDIFIWYQGYAELTTCAV